MNHLIISICTLNIFFNKVICSKAEFAEQIQADMLYNGRLGCYKNIPAHEGESSTAAEMRKKAQWQNDCSFKA